jgi:hypothetical protein
MKTDINSGEYSNATHAAFNDIMRLDPGAVKSITAYRGATDEDIVGTIWYKIREKLLQKNRILLCIMKSFSGKQVNDEDNLAMERPHETTATEASHNQDTAFEADISKAWLLNSMPEFCYANKGNNYHDCPDEFPDLVGNLCFAPC